LQFPQIFVALDEPQAPQTFGSSAANFIATRSCAFVGVRATTLSRRQASG
jgi:hypothetical protein